MKDIRDIINILEDIGSEPEVGDVVEMEFGDTLIETVIDDITEDGIVVHLDETAMRMIIDSHRQFVAESKQGVSEGLVGNDRGDMIRILERTGSIAVNDQGLTQDQWINKVKIKYGNRIVKVLQAKMIDGPMVVILNNGEKLHWSKKLPETVQKNQDLVYERFVPNVLRQASKNELEEYEKFVELATEKLSKVSDEQLLSMAQQLSKYEKDNRIGDRYELMRALSGTSANTNFKLTPIVYSIYNKELDKRGLNKYDPESLTSVDFGGSTGVVTIRGPEAYWEREIAKWGGKRGVDIATSLMNAGYVENFKEFLYMLALVKTMPDLRQELIDSGINVGSLEEYQFYATELKDRGKIGDQQYLNSPFNDERAKEQLAIIREGFGLGESVAEGQAPEIDKDATRDYGAKIYKELADRFGANNIKWKTNSDGTNTLGKMDNVKWAEDIHRQYGKDRDPSWLEYHGVLTGKNFNAAVDPWYKQFRSKGWRFDQPVGGEFTIAVYKQQGVAEDKMRSKDFEERSDELHEKIKQARNKGDKELAAKLQKEYDDLHDEAKKGLLPESEELDEAEYQGRKVPLGKPMKGDVKKSKVYVKGPKGNVVKVNFGDKKMRIKKSNPNRRKSFRARHNCDNPGPRWKARYWSCKAW